MRLDLREEESTCEVVLPNGDTVNVLAPSRAIADSFGQLGKAIICIESEKTTIEQKEEVLRFLDAKVAEIISRNKENRTYTPEDIRDNLSSKQVLKFLTNYADWIRTIIQSKN